jgi:hypothetical protein
MYAQSTGKKYSEYEQVTKKPRDGVKEIEKVCKAVLKLQYEDFIAMDKVAQEQSEYTNPLKMATVKWQHELSIHNKRVMVALRNLQKAIQDGQTIQKP